MAQRKRTVRLWEVLLLGAAALVWIINAILYFAYAAPLGLQIANAVCAFIWCAAFLIRLRRYRYARRQRRPQPAGETDK